jgi:hypothetical protein
MKNETELTIQKKDIFANQKYFEAVLPKNFDVNKFMATLSLEVQKNPKLGKCSNLIEVAKDVASFGLIIGGLAQQSYLIPYSKKSKENNTWTETMTAQLIIGYKGYVSKLEEIQEIRRQEQELEEIMIETHIEQQTAIMEEIMHQEIELEARHGSYVPSIGDPYTGSLLPQKYTLRLDGTIIDRREGVELKDKLGERAIEIGQSLLKHHPTGGRLRLSADGTVVGYEDEEWVVIGSIDLSNWFDT